MLDGNWFIGTSLRSFSRVHTGALYMVHFEYPFPVRCLKYASRNANSFSCEMDLLWWDIAHRRLVAVIWISIPMPTVVVVVMMSSTTTTTWWWYWWAYQLTMERRLRTASLPSILIFNAADVSTFNEGMYDDSKDMFMKFLLWSKTSREGRCVICEIIITIIHIFVITITIIIITFL